MPPTRGHDLKQGVRRNVRIPCKDAPHTGARLETLSTQFENRTPGDAPHTGARLETFCSTSKAQTRRDAPHTGARLETDSEEERAAAQTDAPHTGARLETFAVKSSFSTAGRCPPHGGTT